MIVWVFMERHLELGDFSLQIFSASTSEIKTTAHGLPTGCSSPSPHRKLEKKNSLYFHPTKKRQTFPSYRCCWDFPTVRPAVVTAAHRSERTWLVSNRPRYHYSKRMKKNLLIGIHIHMIHDTLMIRWWYVCLNFGTKSEDKRKIMHLLQ